MQQISAALGASAGQLSGNWCRASVQLVATVLQQQIEWRCHLAEPSLEDGPPWLLCCH